MIDYTKISVNDGLKVVRIYGDFQVSFGLKVFSGFIQSLSVTKFEYLFLTQSNELL